jgi:hypothetical protein
MIGEPFGKLKVLAEARGYGHEKYWLTECLCGRTRRVSTHDLKSNVVTRCAECDRQFARTGQPLDVLWSQLSEVQQTEVALAFKARRLSCQRTGAPWEEGRTLRELLEHPELATQQPVIYSECYDARNYTPLYERVA